MAPRTSTTLSSQRLLPLDKAMGVLLVSVAIIALILVTKAIPNIFFFKPNPYALISGTTFLINFSLLVWLLRRPVRTEPVVWLGLLVSVFTCWSLFETFQRLAATPQTFLFWFQCVYSVLCLAPGFFYLFIRSYTAHSQTSGPIAVPVGVTSSSLLLAVIVASNGAIGQHPELKNATWGYADPMPPLTILVGAWIIIVVLIGIGRLLVHYRRTTTDRDRQQTLLIIFSSLGLVIVGSLIDIFLPALNTVVPPLAVITSSAWCLVATYSISHYGSFIVSVPVIAEGILATMAEAVIVTDAAYKVTYANRQAEDYFGRPDKPLLGQNLARIASGRLVTAAKRITTSDDTSTNVEQVDLSTPDHPFFVNASINPSLDIYHGYIFSLSDITSIKTAAAEAQAQAIKLERVNRELTDSGAAMLNLLEDAHELELKLKHEQASTERKVVARTAELQAAQARLTASINSLNVGFIMTDAQGKFLTINGEVGAIIASASGLHRSHIGITADIVKPILERSIDLSTKIRSCLETGRPVSEPNVAFHSLVLSLYIAPIINQHGRAHDTLGAVVVIEDITEAVLLERSRDEFFSIASHELRTPLTAIRGNTQMISQYYGKDFQDANLKEMLSDIHESSVRLIQIVNDFLDTSRLEQGRIQFKITQFAVEELLNQVVKEYQAAGTTNGLYVHFAQPKSPFHYVSADRDRLRQVIINLVGNGIKFTKQGGVTLSVVVDKNNIAIDVTDTGAGIPADSQGLLFRKFQQASNNMTTDTSRSTGLGLYISRLIMTGMQGTIELASSHIDKGSTFRITVPLAQEKQSHD